MTALLALQLGVSITINTFLLSLFALNYHILNIGLNFDPGMDMGDCRAKVIGVGSARGRNYR